MQPQYPSQHSNERAYHHHLQSNDLCAPREMLNGYPQQEVRWNGRAGPMPQGQQMRYQMADPRQQAPEQPHRRERVMMQPRPGFRSNNSGPFPMFPTNKPSEKDRNQAYGRLSDEMNQMSVSGLPMNGSQQNYHRNGSPRRQRPPQQYYAGPPDMHLNPPPGPVRSVPRSQTLEDNRLVSYPRNDLAYTQQTQEYPGAPQARGRPAFPVSHEEPFQRSKTAPLEAQQNINKRQYEVPPAGQYARPPQNYQREGPRDHHHSEGSGEQIGDVLDAYYTQPYSHAPPQRGPMSDSTQRNQRPDDHYRRGPMPSQMAPAPQQSRLEPYEFRVQQAFGPGPNGFPLPAPNGRKTSPSHVTNGRPLAKPNLVIQTRQGQVGDGASTHAPSPNTLPEHPSPSDMSAHLGARNGMQDMASTRSASHGRPAPAFTQQIVPPSPSIENAVPPQHPITMSELDSLRNEAKASPNDQKLQLMLAKKLIEAANGLSDDGGRADIKTTRKNRENFLAQSFKIVKRLATSSHPYPEAIFFYANCHGNGTLGLAVDHDKAFSLYQSAAKLNHAQSAYRTAVCCEVGNGTRKEPSKSVQWYRKAAALGDTGAMYKLGMILLRGLLGEKKNPREAVSWLKRSAEQADQDHPHALHELGMLYEKQDLADSANGSIIRDDAYALELFTKAARLQYPPAQFRLGCCYEYGSLGCSIDARKSVSWYSRAAENGDAESELALGGWYLTGASNSEGVILEQSDSEAFLWTRKAAEKGKFVLAIWSDYTGLAKAEYALGYFSETGIGVKPDMELAKKYYLLAAQQQHPKAMQRLQDLKKTTRR